MSRSITARISMAALCFAAIALDPAASRAADSTSTPAEADLISELGLHVAPQPIRERSGWSPPHKILTDPRLHGELEALRQIAPAVTFVEVTDQTPRVDIADADAAIGICAAAVLQATPRLQWIQWPAAGVEQCVRQAFVREHRPLITNMQRAAGPSMAEHVMGMMLVSSRQLNYFMREQDHQHWAADSADMPQPFDLNGKTILIVGLGGIGTEVAMRAHAFGMRVIATRASGSGGPDYVSYVGAPNELLTLAKDADFIVNCTPLTPQTTGIFDKAFFTAMKPSAYFFNVGRGGSVVTADLIAALKSQRIAGAGLDVTDPEPLPHDSPLWRMPNVIITPHVSAVTPLADKTRNAVIRENLRRYVAGDAMLSVVDIDRGY